MLTKTLLTTFLIYLSLQQEVIDITEIQEGYDWLFNAQKFCKDRRVAMTTDKPVYKIGETAYITVYFYNLYSKAPINKCKDNKFVSLEIQDSDDKYVLRVDNKQKNDDEIQDYSSFSFEQKILEDKFKGGVYKLIYNGGMRDEVKFFVLEFNNRKAGVVSNWNVETIKPGDILEGTVTLKSFTKESQFSDVVAEYTFLDANGNTLSTQSNIKVLNNRLNIFYQVPQNIGGLLILDVVFIADNVRVPYKKEFQEAQFDDIEIEFTPGTSKVALNARNTFYFRAFKGKEKIFTTQITNARLIKKIRNLNQVVIDNISTNNEGMGKFTFFISDEDIERGVVFSLQVKFSEFNIRNFLLLDTNKLDYSDVALELDQRIYNMDDTIQLGLTNLKSNKDYTVVIQDKTKIYQEDIISNIRRSEQKLNFEINKLGLLNGGVYTIQVYSQVSKEEKERLIKKQEEEYIKQQEDEQRQNQIKRGVAEDRIRIYPVRPPKKDIKFLGELQQEILIFIKPKYLLNASVQFDKESYGPGETVKFVIDEQKNCQYCPSNSNNIRAVVEVVDASAFVEVDQSSTSSSLFTKIFLEKEIYNEKNEFRNNQRYIDYLFNTDLRNDANVQQQDQRLDLLLGNQKWRQLFLGLDNLQDYQQNKWNDQYKKYRDHYDYLLPTQSFGMIRTVQYEAPPVMFMARAQPMQQVQFAEAQFDAMGGAVNNQVLRKNVRAEVAPVPEVEEQELIVDEPSKEDKEDEEDQEKQLEKFLKQDNIFYQSSTSFNKENKIEGKFKLPKEVQTFRMRILLYDDNGNYGVVYKQLTTKKDYNVYVEEPTFILSDETFKVKLVIENSTDQPENITFQKPFIFNVLVPGNSSQTYQVSLNKNNIPFTILAQSSNGNTVGDLTINPTIIKSGITINKGVSEYISTQRGSNSMVSYDGIIPQDLISGNTTMKVCYNNPGIGLILDAIEKMNRIPTGCFEQASSTNFPLVLALQIILQLPKTPRTEEIKKKLLENLKKGIKLLLKYETDDGGFEWFGKSPGHSTLTAYGLWQFREISNLNLEEDLFDKNLLQRLKNFLQKNKNKEGGWTITRGLDSLGNPPQEISDKYIAFVLSVEFQEIQELFNEQFESMDDDLEKFKNGDDIESYQLVLLGLYAKNKNDLIVARQILQELLERQNKKDGYIQKSETSITRSSGSSLQVETTALTIMLFIDVEGQQIESLQMMIEFLTKNLNQGYFGSTQATILSLLAFRKYLVEFTSSSEKDIVLNININGRFVSQLRANATDLLSQNSCSDITQEFQEIEVKGSKFEISTQPNVNYLTQDNNRYLISIEHSYQQLLPDSVQDSPLKATIQKNEASNTRIYEVTLQNTVDKEQGMTVIEFNKPSCMEFNISELDNLRLQGDIDYFELLNSNSLEPNSRKNFRFSMNNRYILNQCAERTHMIYLYYDKEGSVLYKRADQFIK